VYFVSFHVSIFGSLKKLLLSYLSVQFPFWVIGDKIMVMPSLTSTILAFTAGLAVWFASRLYVMRRRMRGLVSILFHRSLTGIVLMDSNLLPPITLTTLFSHPARTSPPPHLRPPPRRPRVRRKLPCRCPLPRVRRLPPPQIQPGQILLHGLLAFRPPISLDH
jgi:hypothetical protein